MKDYTSNVESSRVMCEEPIKTMGSNINPEQIWRDAKLIPKAPSLTDSSKWSVRSQGNITEDDSTYSSFTFSNYSFNDGEESLFLIRRVEDLTLKLQEGTLNVYKSNALKDIFGREFDGDIATPVNTWHYTIKVDDTVLSYNAGNQVVDSAAGTIMFLDKEFSENILGKIVKIDFYKYIGRKGFFGYEEQEGAQGIGLPFRDDLILLKDHTQNDRTASFVLRGPEHTNTQYMLPPFEGFIKKSEEDKNAGVIMLQENYNEVVWNIGDHDGGYYSTAYDKPIRHPEFKN